MNWVMIVMCWAFATVSGVAMDAESPPKVMTLQKTFLAAEKVVIPVVSFTNATVKDGIEFLDHSVGTSAGFSLNIDAKAVEGREMKPLMAMERRNVSWMEMLGLIADQLDASIVVEPGVFKLVPRMDREMKNQK